MPAAIPAWTNVAPANVTVLWHVEHCSSVGGCDDVIVTLLMRALCVWQPMQVFGVSLNTPRTWQLSQRVFWWAPVSANPVARCCATESASGSEPLRPCAAALPASAIVSSPKAIAQTRERMSARKDGNAQSMVIGGPRCPCLPRPRSPASRCACPAP